MRPTHAALLSALLLLAIPALARSEDIATRAQRVTTLAEQFPRPDDLAFARAMQQAYATNFGQQDAARKLRTTSAADLKLHWDAVAAAAFYSDDAALLDSTVRVHAELERRGLADAASTTRLFNFLLKARRFEDARALATKQPVLELPHVPDFIDTGTAQPSVWRFSADGRKARRIGIDLRPRQIIVIAGCHFSADAARDIAADPMLGPIFARHAHWLALPPGAEKLDALAEWNRMHAATPMLPIHDRGEWALIPQWTMPTFAIVENGTLIDSVKGWKSGDPAFRQQLVALLQRANLIKAGAP